MTKADILTDSILATNIGYLDLSLSAALESAKDHGCDPCGPNCPSRIHHQTLKHHARDCIAVGRRMLELLGEVES